MNRWRTIILVLCLTFILVSCSSKFQSENIQASSAASNIASLEISSGIPTPSVLEGEPTRKSEMEILREQIYSFFWYFDINKPFLENNANGPDYLVYIVDLNQDGINEIIISNINSPRDVPPNEVFSFVNNKLVSMGGFWGILGAKEETTSDEADKGIISIYETHGKKQAFMQWTRSSHGGIDTISYSEVTFFPMQYTLFVTYQAPYMEVDGMEGLRYYKINDAKHFVREMETVIYEDLKITEAVSKEEYEAILNYHKSELTWVADVPYTYVTSYNKFYKLLEDNPENLSVEDYIVRMKGSEEVKKANQDIAQKIYDAFIS